MTESVGMKRKYGENLFTTDLPAQSFGPNTGENDPISTDFPNKKPCLEEAPGRQIVCLAEEFYSDPTDKEIYNLFKNGYIAQECSKIKKRLNRGQNIQAINLAVRLDPLRKNRADFPGFPVSTIMELIQQIGEDLLLKQKEIEDNVYRWHPAAASNNPECLSIYYSIVREKETVKRDEAVKAGLTDQALDSAVLVHLLDPTDKNAAHICSLAAKRLTPPALPLLPVELWKYIFTFVDAKDLPSVFLVSKEFKMFLTDNVECHSCSLAGASDETLHPLKLMHHLCHDSTQSFYYDGLDLDESGLNIFKCLYFDKYVSFLTNSSNEPFVFFNLINKERIEINASEDLLNRLRGNGLKIKKINGNQFILSILDKIEEGYQWHVIGELSDKKITLTYLLKDKEHYDYQYFPKIPTHVFSNNSDNNETRLIEIDLESKKEREIADVGSTFDLYCANNRFLAIRPRNYDTRPPVNLIIRETGELCDFPIADWKGHSEHISMENNNDIFYIENNGIARYYDYSCQKNKEIAGLQQEKVDRIFSLKSKDRLLFKSKEHMTEASTIYMVNSFSRKLIWKFSLDEATIRVIEYTHFFAILVQSARNANMRDLYLFDWDSGQKYACIRDVNLVGDCFIQIEKEPGQSDRYRIDCTWI